MRTALLFQKNNFVGREYYAQLDAAGLRPDLVIAVGRMKSESIAFEQARTEGRWDPPEIPPGRVTHEFDDLSDGGLAQLLQEQTIDVAVQGGIGILKGDILLAPRIGFLNIHPGRLPQYRGNSCPEWAIFNGEPVYVTAHLIDEGIDTGPVVIEAPYEIDPTWTYSDFRANLYSCCGTVAVQALRRFAAARPGTPVGQPQPSAGARYWPPIDEATLAAVHALFPLGDNNISLRRKND